MWDPYGEFERHILPNGLEAFVSQWPGRAWAAFGFIVHTGAECDPLGKEGLAHFVEHMVNENAAIPHEGMEAFFEEQGGGAYFGGTNFVSTIYNFFLPADPGLIARGLELFSSMLVSAKLELALEQQRDIIHGEHRRRFPVSATSWDLRARAHRMLYQGTRFERIVHALGSLESISRIGLDDIRTFYDLHYVPANISVVALSGLPTEQMLGLIAESPFGTIAKSGARNPVPERLDPLPPLESEGTFSLRGHVQGAENGSYASAAVLPMPRLEQSISVALEILATVLNDEVREKRGWTYSISTETLRLRSFTSMIINCQSLKPEGLSEIGAVVNGCIASANDRTDLFDRVKKRRLLSRKLFDPTGKGIVGDILDDLSSYQRIVTLDEDQAETEATTMDDVRAVLSHLSHRRWTLITTP